MPARDPKASIAMRIRWLITIAGTLLPVAAQAADLYLQLESRIALGSVAGRIDHLAFDPTRQRLYVAELGNNSVGVVDLNTRQTLRTIGEFDEPQGIAYEPGTDTIYVANGGNGNVEVFKGDDFSRLATIATGSDADNVRVDSEAHRVVVGYGDGALLIIDPVSRSKVAEIALPGHPEGFQLAPDGDRIFVNVPDSRQIVVVSRKSAGLVTSWQTASRANYPIALDAAHGVILSAFREPARLGAFDVDTGRQRADSGICGDSDDVFVDARRDRVYVICGQGVVDVLSPVSGTFTRFARVPTSSGSRTGLFVPGIDRLFVAVRAAGSQPAEIRVYRPMP